MCRERGRPKNFASEPKCAFPDGGQFTHDNWNCATANAIRDIAESERPGVARDYSDDQSYATVSVYEIEDVWDCGAEDHNYWCLWLTWYKRRGRTEALWLMGSDDAPPRRPTEAQARLILDHYERYVPKAVAP